MAILNGKTEAQIRNEYEKVYEQSRAQRSDELWKEAQNLRLQLTAIEDAKYAAATPDERRQTHIDAGLIPYDASAYTDEAVAAWNEKYATPERRQLASQVQL